MAWEKPELAAVQAHQHGPNALSQPCLSEPSSASTPAPETAWCAAKQQPPGVSDAPGQLAPMVGL